MEIELFFAANKRMITLLISYLPQSGYSTNKKPAIVNTPQKRLTPGATIEVAPGVILLYVHIRYVRKNSGEQSKRGRA